MKQLYVHIGPFKTGTTAIQEYFWSRRDSYIDCGLLYPRTGIVSRNWGHRHARLAVEYRKSRWDRLVAEIEESGCDKVLLSSERFSQRAAVLAAAKPHIERYNPRMIVFVRDECDLVRSMYLQVVKGRYATRDRDAKDPIDNFAVWWGANKWRYVYARMLTEWAKIYGEGSIEVVSYRRSATSDSISDICRVLGVPEFERPKLLESNLSIGGFAARLSVAAARLGMDPAHYALRTGILLENRIPALAKMAVRGFDPDQVATYYNEVNRIAMKQFPAFGQIYESIRAASDSSGKMT